MFGEPCAARGYKVLTTEVGGMGRSLETTEGRADLPLTRALPRRVLDHQGRINGGCPDRVRIWPQEVLDLLVMDH